MRRTSKRLSLAILVGLCVFGSRADAEPAAVRLYTTAASSFEEGTIDATFILTNDGFRFGNVSVQPGRSTIARMHLKLKAGKTLRGNVSFAPPISASVPALMGPRQAPPTRQRIEIESVEFDGNGSVGAVQLSNGTALPTEQVATVRPALQLEVAKERVLAGRLFKREHQAKCDAVGTPCRGARRLVSKVSWTANGFSAPFTVWKLVDRTGSDCFEFVTARSPIRVVRADYHTATADTEVELASDGFTVNRQSCIGLSSPQLRLNIPTGSFAIAKLAASSSGAIANKDSVDQIDVKLRGGSLELSKGSQLEIAQDSDVIDHLALDSGTLAFASLNASILKDKVATLDIDSATGAASRSSTQLKAKLGKSTLRLWRRSFVTVENGEITIPMVTGHWSPAGRPVVVADANSVSIDLAIGEGVMRWNEDTRFQSAKGVIKGTKLNFDGRYGTAFTGTFTQFEVSTTKGGNLRLPSSFAVQRIDAVDLHASDAAAPLKIEDSDAFPTGRLALAGQAEEMTSTVDKAVSCENPNFETDVIFTDDGYKLKKPLHCAGKYTADVSGTKVRADVTLDVPDLVLANGSLKGAGSLSVSVPAGTVLPVKITGDAEKEQNVGFWPVDKVRTRTNDFELSVTLQQRVTFSGAVTLNDQNINFASSQTPSFSVALNGDAEVFTAKVVLEWPLPDCTYHVFAEQGVYNTTATLDLGIKNSIGTLSLRGIGAFSPGLRHHEDGCDGAMIALDAIIAYLLPVGVIGADIARRIAIDQIVTSLVAKKLEEMSKELARKDITPLLDSGDLP